MLAFVFYPFNSAILKIKTHRKGEKRMKMRFEHLSEEKEDE